MSERKRVKTADGIFAKLGDVVYRMCKGELIETKIFSIRGVGAYLHDPLIYWTKEACVAAAIERQKQVIRSNQEYLRQLEMLQVQQQNLEPVEP